jgi:serine/threonine protein kinase
MQGELGRDGTDIVYVARSLRLDRAVALKFLSAEAASDPKRLDQFRHDARSASALNHPAICTLYDIGECDGRPFLALEYVEGCTLRSCIDEFPRVDRASPSPARSRKLFGSLTPPISHTGTSSRKT